MDDIHDLYSFLIIFSDNPLSMTGSIGCTSLRREEDDDILLVWIDGITQCDDILFDDIVRLCIYRYDDNMSEMLCSF